MRCFIGYDAREWLAWQVCAASMQATASVPVGVAPVGRTALVQSGQYTRTQSERGGLQWDDISDEPCSTDFSIARFWVPTMAGRAGWVLYCDSDFIWRNDVRKLFELADSRYAVMVVKHQFVPTETVKMDGQIQTSYPRKAWSALVLWNLSHAGAQRLNHYKLNTMTRRELHQFSWLRDDEIGELPGAWHWLDGHSPATDNPHAVHLTRGTPDMAGWEFTQYSQEWCRYAQIFKRKAA